MERPPRTEPPSHVKCSLRIEPNAPIQRPPRTRNPGPLQQPPICETSGPMQRAPMSGSGGAKHIVVASVQRPPRSEPPGPVQRPPRIEPPARMTKTSKVTISTMERPPRTDAPVPVERPPRTVAPVPADRPPRADNTVHMQRPPRTNPPAPVQRPPRTDAPLQSPTMAVQGGLRMDPAVSMQRPPRTDNPAPVNLPPRYELSGPVHRTPRSDPPRPPRSEPPGPIQRLLRTEPPGPVLKNVGSESSETKQKSAKTASSDRLQRPPRGGILDPASTHGAYGRESLPAVQTPSTTADLSPKKGDTRSPPQRTDGIEHVDLGVCGNSQTSELTGDGSNTGLIPGEHSCLDSDQRAEVGAELEPAKADENSPDDPPRSPEKTDAGGHLSPGNSPLPSEEDSELFIPLEEQGGGDDQQKKRRKRKVLGKRKRENKQVEDNDPLTCDLDQDLDRALEDRAKHHNLTVVNVRNILHEVITNEHVVAMMKAAITDTESLPMFEPKMTRSKLKEVVEKGVVIPTWNLSPIKKANKMQVPQFVDIPLEEEDSSDEEYRPEEEEEDETAEESLLESDVESTASSPRGHKRPRLQHLSESQEEESMDCHQFQQLPPAGVRHISAEMVPMGPPPPPKVGKHIQDSSFMETLHAVDEELDSNPVIMNAFQTLNDSLIAFRTRSKRPLKDVPIEQLEAKLQAPDITPDMYDPNTADDDNWKMWLRSLMQVDVGNEDEADDDDDPEYNILEDWDEPDTEDLRNDRAVRITKKEVNELMEELFETFQDEMGISHLEDEGPDDEDSNTDPLPNFNTPQAIRFEEPLANLLTEQHRTVRAQLEFLRMRKSMLKTEEDRSPVREPEIPIPPAPPKCPPIMSLDAVQKIRLQQQMQQHVQLLTQVHLLTFRNPRLSQEASTAQMYLVELSSFAESSAMSHRPLNSDFQSMFEACNLKDALQLIPLVHSQVPEDTEPPKPPKKKVNEMTNLPTHVAWIMATRPLFMYPELLPICAMKARGPRDRVFFTKAEDNLLALGLKHFEGTDLSKQLISKYLLTPKTSQQLTVRIKNLMKKAPENIFKFYKRTNVLPVLGKCCDDVQAEDAKPAVEREKHRLPFWIKASLSSIEAEIKKLEEGTKSADSRYPLLIPLGVTLTLKPLPRSFYRKAWRQKRSTLKPLLIRPSPSINCAPKPPAKPPSPQTLPIGIFGQVPPVIQPDVPVQGIAGLPVECKVPEVCVPVLSQKQPSQVSTATVTHVPLTKMAMPPITTQRVRKPLIGGLPKRKTVSRASGARAAPLVHSGPLLFAVPNGALKLVSLGTPCSVLQAVSTGSGVHVATVLLNSTQMPLNQTFPQTLVSMPREVHENHTSPTMEADVESIVKKEEDEWDCVSITIKVKAEGNHSAAGEGVEEEVGGSKGTPKGNSGDSEDPSPSENKPLEESDCSANVKELVSPNEEKPELKTESGEVDIVQPDFKDEPGEQITKTESTNAEPVDMQDPEDVPEDDSTEVNEPQNQETGGVGDSPKNTSSSTDGDVEMSSPAGILRDSSSPLDGQEMSNEKDVPEDEEEEEFDMTQDEDEMSSASEESVLSVPELQETMEKLTWLASERRLSQEGDSEDNSQEENTEPEEEEEEEAESIEGLSQKPEGMTDEASEESEKLVTSHLRVPSPAPVEACVAPAGERRRGGSKGQSSHRVRSRRGRARASKDASKLLLLYDEKILMKDPLREQKDMAFAQSYLSRVREALQSVPGTYEEFLNLIYEFETRGDKRTAVDLYESLRQLLQDWPQLLKDFAAFLLPEQALECGLFEEQQAFDKSRKFLRQLEICFLENPAQHQKIIKLLQSCAECPLQEIGKLKTQMWQLLKGHIHLQEEFSLFFDQLRPPASRMGDFEVMNWTEDKEYKFDGFEEVTLPDDEEEEEQNKMPSAQRNKKRKDPSQGQDKDADWMDGGKDCPCSCHEGGTEQRLKRCKRRMCSHCSSKKSTDVAGPQAAFRQGTSMKEPGSKSVSSEDRPTPGARGPASNRGLSIPESNVSAQRSRSVSTARGVLGTDSTSKPRPQSKDNTRTTSRGGRRLHTVKGPHPAAVAEKDEDTAQPKTNPSVESVTDHTETSVECPPLCSTLPTTPSVSHLDVDLSSTTESLQPSDASEREEQTNTVCAKNIKVSSSGEKVILWTREADRVILTMCQEKGAHDETFEAVSVQLGNKSASEVSQRFRELINLFQTGSVTSSDEEEEEESAGLGNQIASDLDD